MTQAIYLRVFALVWFFCLWSPALHAQPNLSGPDGSGRFGTQVIYLLNGNMIVTDTQYRLPGTQTNTGAVYLYGPNHKLISALVGSSSEDLVGQEPIVILAHGNFLVRSPAWGPGNTGAVTWCSGVVGCHGTISSANSLVGSNGTDRVGEHVVALENGNYVVLSPNWSEGVVTAVGAVTWGNGQSGVRGEISVSNSLIGGQTADHVGYSGGITLLSDSSYVVHSPIWQEAVAPFHFGAITFSNGLSPITGRVSAENSFLGSPSIDGSGFFSPKIIELNDGKLLVADETWNDGLVSNVGAVTWVASGASLVGEASPLNSLVGSNPRDYVGTHVLALQIGQYAVGSPNWRSKQGAVTLSRGATPLTGRISEANSLVGNRPGDQVGWSLTRLDNGNLVVSNPFWRGEPGKRFGALNFISSVSPLVGQVTTSNSLYAVEPSYFEPNFRITPLKHGNYVISCSNCTINSKSEAGAVVFASGASGIMGPLTTANSLHGGEARDQVGLHVLALNSGNFLVLSPYWSENLGAATFISGQTGMKGIISSLNSLVGNQPYDFVGIYGVALSDGNYVVASPHWANGAIADAGAASFGSGVSGVVGRVSGQNSLVGTQAGDQISSSGIAELGTGRVVVSSKYWSSDTASAVGAITIADAATELVGAVSAGNSLVGKQTNNHVGTGSLGLQQIKFDRLTEKLVIFSPRFQDPPTGRYGAVSWINTGSGQADQTGELSTSNSVFGTSGGATAQESVDVDSARAVLAIGQPNLNRIVFFQNDALFRASFDH